MQGFARRHTVQAALAWLDAQLHPLDAEDVPLREAAGRVLAAPVVSDDRYARIRSRDDGWLRRRRRLHRRRNAIQPDSHEDRRRRVARLAIRPNGGRGEAVRIMTGAPMPLAATPCFPAEWVESRC